MVVVEEEEMAEVVAVAVAMVVGVVVGVVEWWRSHHNARAAAATASTSRGPTQRMEAALKMESRGRLCCWLPEKIFQKRSVSSAAAVTTVVPSGDCAICSTRDVCPVNSAT